MTCFWDGIISSLDKDDLNILCLKNKPTPRELSTILKNLNKKTPDILWEKQPLRINEIEENFIHIRDFSNITITSGYLCSVCDPFLCLLTDILCVNISHTYLDNTFCYTKKDARKTLYYKSDRGHFWKEK